MYAPTTAFLKMGPANRKKISNLLLFHQSIADLASCLLFGLLKCALELHLSVLAYNFAVQVTQSESTEQTFESDEWKELRAWDLVYENLNYRVLGMTLFVVPLQMLNGSLWTNTWFLK